MEVYNYNKKLIEQWLKESQNKDSSLFFRFSSLWVAFNHFLAARYQQDSDGKLLKEFYEEYKDFFRYLVNLNVDLKNRVLKLKDETPVWDERPSHQKEKKVIENEADVKQVFDVIYLVRCNLLHGSKMFDADRDNELVKLAYEILSKVVDELVKNK